MDPILEKKIKINGVKCGLGLGIIIAVLSIFSFYFITGLTTSALLFIAGPIVFRLFIPIFTVLFLCFNMRKSIGGLWTFRQATTGIFIMFITAYVINFIGKDLLFDKVIQPDSVQLTQQAAINAKTANMKQKGADQQKINASIADMKKEIIQKSDVTVLNVFIGNAIVIIFLFVFALIFGSLLRNAEYIPLAQRKE